VRTTSAVLPASLRVLVDTLPACYQALGQVYALWTPAVLTEVLLDEAMGGVWLTLLSPSLGRVGRVDYARSARTPTQ
jgi:hypothetical protein